MLRRPSQNPTDEDYSEEVYECSFDLYYVGKCDIEGVRSVRESTVPPGAKIGDIHRQKVIIIGHEENSGAGTEEKTGICNCNIQYTYCQGCTIIEKKIAIQIHTPIQSNFQKDCDLEFLTI